MSEPIISFCIPTYNRKDQVCHCVSEILKYKGDNIEIVVSDNGSFDGTLEYLEKINDARLRLTGFPKNMLFTANLLNAASCATGKFIFFLSDEDTVVNENIPYLTNIVTKYGDGVSLIMGTNIGPDAKIHMLDFCTQGYNAYYEYAFTEGYMSGIILNRKTLDVYNSNLKSFDYYYNLFPHVLLVTEATLKGNVISLNKVFTIQGDVKFIDFSSKEYSGVYKGKHFFELENIIIELKEQLLHIKSTAFNDFEKIKIFLKLSFSQAIHAAYVKQERLENLEYANLYNYKTESSISALDYLDAVVKWGYEHLTDIADNEFTRELSKLALELFNATDTDFLCSYNNESESILIQILMEWLPYIRVRKLQLEKNIERITLYEDVKRVGIRLDVAKAYISLHNDSKALYLLNDLLTVADNSFDFKYQTTFLLISATYYSALAHFNLQEYNSAKLQFKKAQHLAKTLTYRDHSKAKEYIEKIEQMCLER